MKRILVFFVIMLSSLVLIFGCNKQGNEDNLTEINAAEIDKIICAGSTGGKDGTFKYSMAENEIDGFVKLLNQVNLGDEVDKNKVLSSGAVVYYTIQFTDDKTLEISPGKYFMIGETYYYFENYNELWGEFIKFNSLR